MSFVVYKEVPLVVLSVREASDPREVHRRCSGCWHFARGGRVQLLRPASCGLKVLQEFGLPGLLCRRG